jgi:uncharacterized repeat protein (TIGR01451 family)
MRSSKPRSPLRLIAFLALAVALFSAAQAMATQPTGDRVCKPTTPPVVPPPVVPPPVVPPPVTPPVVAPPVTPPVTAPVVTPPGVIGTTAPTLAITKRPNRRVVRLGQIVTFRIQVRNTGTATATNLQVCDRVPARAVFVSAKGATIKNGLVCFALSKLDPGKTARFLVTFRAVAVGTIRNVATASASNAATVTARANVRVIEVLGAIRVPVVTG